MNNAMISTLVWSLALALCFTSIALAGIGLWSLLQ